MKSIWIWNCRKRLMKVAAKHMPGFRLRRAALRAAGYRVGKDVYVGEDLIIIDELADKGMVSFGDRAAVAERVTLIVSSNPNSSRIRPAVREAHAPIAVGADAWLGACCVIMPGITIGPGAVVGAGAVVTHNVPGCTVVAGVPARPLRKLECPGPAVEADRGEEVTVATFVPMNGTSRPGAGAPAWREKRP